jgi:hypothetical protein
MKTAVHSLQMLVNFYKTMWFHIQADGVLHHHHGNLKPTFKGSHHHGNLKPTKIKKTDLKSLTFNIQHSMRESL